MPLPIENSSYALAFIVRNAVRSQPCVDVLKELTSTELKLRQTEKQVGADKHTNKMVGGCTYTQEYNLESIILLMCIVGAVITRAGARPDP